MARIQARVLKGFRDYLPEDMLPRHRMLQRVEKVFLAHGFAPIQTPALEYSDVLVGKYGEEGDKLLYRFEDNGGRDIALRYDLTVPLARVVAQNANLALPFKRYQIAPVWRAEKPARGRFREFMQCDADIIGAAGSPAEVEILSIGETILSSLEVGPFTIRVNHRGVFDGLAKSLSLDDDEEKAGMVRTLDKLDKIGQERVLGLLVEEIGISAEKMPRVESFLALPKGDLDTAKDFFNDNPEGSEAIENLRETVELIGSTGKGERLLADLSLARGLNYYTGLIYEARLDEQPEFGSVMGGGRYDGLMDIFGAPPHPAVGISLGVDRLHAALQEQAEKTQRTSPTEVLVVVFNREGFSAAARLANQFREGGVAAEVFLNPKTKMGKQFRYADRKGIPYVAVQGSDELADGSVRLKDLQTGEETTLLQADVCNWIKEKTA